MALTLTITSYQSQVLGSDGRREFGKSGGSIGRAQGNDWVLPDPERFISAQHFTLSYHGNAYYLTDTSVNGVFINQKTTPVGKGNSVQLNDGDRLDVGDYEIIVSIDDDAGDVDPSGAWPGQDVAADTDSSAEGVADAGEFPESDFPDLEQPTGVEFDRTDTFSVPEEAAGYAILDLPKPLYEQVISRALVEASKKHSPDVAVSAHKDSPAPTDLAAPQGRRLVQYAILAGVIALAAWLGIKLLPLIVGATSSVKPRRPDESTDETHPVDCSVFAPPKLAVGDAVLVQVYLHPPGRAEEAEAGAKQFDFDAEWRGFTSLSLDLTSGTRVAIQLDLEGMDVSDDGFGEVRWNNSVVGVSFQVISPERARPGKHFGTVRLLVDGVPAGRIHFIIEVDASLEGKVPPEGIGDSAHRYRKAFISYASEDRAEVLKRVQTLGALKIDYFQDVLDLEPGDRWEQELYKEIDKCDLFLLFWSSAARDSKWVYQEAQYARQRQIRLMKDEPDIIPMMIEGPPPPKPWSDFKHLHFNDKLIYLMRSQEDDWDWSG